jgi:N4-gp56 family major capsid protein
VFYERAALTPLRKVFMFWNLVDNRTLPKRNGKTVQFYRYSQLGANTTAATEGAVGTSLELTSTTLSATVAQYADFISFSDLLVDTAIDNDIIAVGADQLGYRAGLTCDTILRNEFDSVAASIDVTPLGDYFSGADLANIRHRMAGLDIMGMNGGDTFPTVAHPYVTYDLIHDPNVGGFVDVNKQPGAAGQSKLQSVQGRGLLLRFNNCEVYESTNCTVVAGSPNKYRTYFAGQEGIAAIDLAGRGPTRSKDQNRQKFNIHVIREEKPSIANPEGKIRGAVSYNFVWVTKILDTNPYRIRKIDFPSSLGL